MFNFEKLEVWNEALSFAGTIYTLTKAFPEDERFVQPAALGNGAMTSPLHTGRSGPALPERWSPSAQERSEPNQNPGEMTC
jgi:hypothetical protein